ncbi:hypothetical protein ACFPT7_18875 [Acidicapsa dinghuensis]|uniref:Zf-HC2 domain-containing protein n=1 Tax=Acidicapsa dinghuensis TaxID=2218256 RepID=A0ABW1EKV8_9BACT|nr:hypothetical protein [Acidicapsa dinghuensis]
MIVRNCTHEAEIKRLLALGHWPQAAPADLCEHAEACRSCADQILVSQAFRKARGASMAQAQLPSAGVIWWRAQLRKRNAAVERINRPIIVAQILAFAATLCLAGLFVYTELRQGIPWKSWLASAAQSSAFDWKALWPSGATGWFKPEMNAVSLTIGLVLLAIMGGVVYFFASEKE